MASVQFTSALRRFFPDLKATVVKGETIMEVLITLENQYSGLLHYLLDDQKELRKHVNIFVNGSIMNRNHSLHQPVDDDSEIFIVQALSGG